MKQCHEHYRVSPRQKIFAPISSVLICDTYTLFQGYLQSLGMARTAEVKRDARIGEAEAKRDARIKEAIAEEERMASK